MSLRDSFADVLTQLFADRLPEQEAESLLDDGDARASLRLLANALLNVASTTGPAALGTLRKVLPWLEMVARRELDGGRAVTDGLDSEEWPACAHWFDEVDDEASARPFRETLMAAARDEALLEELADGS
ncbi:MAG: hypothetical protein ABEN55_11675, partial [Bradymonadaceae bacterium]